MHEHENQTPGSIHVERGLDQQTERRRRVGLARFSVPEQMTFEVVSRARARLGEVGIYSYELEVAGAGEPLMFIGGRAYSGEHDIDAAVENVVRERSEER